MSNITDIKPCQFEDFINVQLILCDNKELDSYNNLKIFRNDLKIKKLDDSYKTKLDLSFPNIILNTRSWIAGGAIRDTLLNKEYKDIDIFSNSFTDSIEFIIRNNLLSNSEIIIDDTVKSKTVIKNLNNIKTNINLYIERPGDFAKYLTSNPLYKLDFLRNDGKLIQVMLQQNYNTPQECINAFDLTICQFAYDGTNLIYFDESINDLKNKIIRLHKLNDKGFFYPNFKRIIRFLNEGYKLHKRSYTDMIINFEKVIKKQSEMLDSYFDAVEYLNNSEEKVKTINLKNKFYFLELNSMLSEENFV